MPYPPTVDTRVVTVGVPRTIIGWDGVDAEVTLTPLLPITLDLAGGAPVLPVKTVLHLGEDNGWSAQVEVIASDSRGISTTGFDYQVAWRFPGRDLTIKPFRVRVPRWTGTGQAPALDLDVVLPVSVPGAPVTSIPVVTPDALEQRLAGLGGSPGVDVSKLATKVALSDLADEVDEKYVRPAEGIPLADLAQAVLDAINAGSGGGGGATTIAQVEGLESALGARATPAQITAAIDALKGSVPATYDTLVEIATELSRGATAETSLLTALGQRITQTDADARYATPTIVATAVADRLTQEAGDARYATPTSVASAVAAGVADKLTATAADGRYATPAAVELKYTKPPAGIPAADLTEGARTALAAAGTAVQPGALNSYAPLVNGKVPQQYLHSGTDGGTDTTPAVVDGGGASSSTSQDTTIDGGGAAA